MTKFDLYESRLFGKICYGFGRDEKRYVYIKDDEVDVVRMIYNMAINGHSLQNIQAKLYKRGIKSPSDRDKWTRDVIDKTNNVNLAKCIDIFEKMSIIIITEPDTPLNDADHVGSFNLYGSGMYGT